MTATRVARFVSVLNLAGISSAIEHLSRTSPPTANPSESSASHERCHVGTRMFASVRLSTKGKSNREGNTQEETEEENNGETTKE